MDTDFEVLICGAGPVGLLLANLLGKAGVSVMAIDKRSELPDMSMAIGITPPSLGILRRVGLARRFADAGVQIHRAHVINDGDEVGSLTFDGLEGEFPFILSLPQHATLRFLQDAVEEQPGVSLRRGVELIDFDEQGDRVAVTVESGNGGGETITCKYLVGCDGARGRTREILELGDNEKDYGLDFLMADFVDDTDWGKEAYLFFTADGSVEAFPLPDRRRRWVILKRDAERSAQDLVDRVKARTGVDVRAETAAGLSEFHPRCRLSRRYFRGRVVLCGDAAHVLSPIGGQGMNTGLADAEFLSEALVRVLVGELTTADAFPAYERYRRPAFEAAAARSGRGMWLGTRTGRLASAIRGFVLKYAILRGPVRAILPKYFAMQRLPNNRFTREMLAG